MMEWKDETSYSRGQRGKTEPSVWTAKAGELDLVVHRYVGLDGWYMSCYKLNIKQHPLKSENIEDAKTEAIERFDLYLANKIDDLEQARLILKGESS